MANITTILKNPVLYKDALDEKEKNTFSWHTHADDIRSSQVFSLSAFGSLRKYTEKDEIINSLLCSCFKDITTGKWTIEPEANDRKLLGEMGNQPTSIDMLFTSKDAVICMESKYIEDAKTGFGGCGQYKDGNCKGFYGPGSDEKCRTQAWCRLENWDGKRSPRLYWSLGKRYCKPEVFRMQAHGETCPFFGPFYQLMRNVLFAATFAEVKGLSHWGVVAICPKKNAIPLTHQVNSLKRTILLSEFQDNVQLIQYEDYISILNLYEGQPSVLGDHLQKYLP